LEDEEKRSGNLVWTYFEHCCCNFIRAVGLFKIKLFDNCYDFSMRKGNISEGITGEGCKSWEVGMNIEGLTLKCKIVVKYRSFILEI